MAYDAEIRINTKVNLKEFDNLTKEINQTSNALDKSNEKVMRLKDKLAQTGKSSKEYANIKREIALTTKEGNRLAIALDEAEKKASDFAKAHGVNMWVNKDSSVKAKGELEKVETGYKNVSKSADKMKESVEKSSTKGASAIGKFGKRVWGLIKRVFVFSLITKALRAMVQGINEGLKNFAQFDKQYNKVMSDFKSQTATLKNALASAFAPIVEMLVPALTKLAEVLTFVADKMSQLFAVLNGKNSFAKAKKQVVDYSKAVKDASNSLAGFDDINTLSQSGDASGAGMFTMANVDESILTFGERIKAVFDELKESVSNWWGELDFTPLIDSLTRLKNTCAPLIDAIGNGLKWVLENVLEPLGSFVIEDALPAFFNVWATEVEALKKIFEGLSPALEYIWQSLLVPFGQFLGETFLNLLTIVSDAFAGLGDLFETRGGKISNIINTIVKVIQIFGTIAKSVIQFVTGIVGSLVNTVIKIVGHVIDVLDGLINFIKDVFKGDWESAWSDVKDVFIGLWDIILDTFEGIVNAIINGINSLSFDVPDWVPGIGGEHVGFNLQKVDWGRARLATGGIVDRPTRALIGEAGREAVVPLENNTEWMDILSERIGSGNVTIKFDGNLAQLARVLNPVLDTERTRIGTRLVVE